MTQTNEYDNDNSSGHLETRDLSVKLFNIRRRTPFESEQQAVYDSVNLYN